MLNLRSKILVVATTALVSVLLGNIVLADIPQACLNRVCGRSTYDGTRVHIYLSHYGGPFTHYNFKTNPGRQIELTTDHYSFEARNGRHGSYSVQSCARGPAIVGVHLRSICGRWTTFDWVAERR